MSKRTIPQIRARLLEIADELAERPNPADLVLLSAEVRQLAFETVRNSPSRKRAPVKHSPLTAADKTAIRVYAKRNPEIHIAEIAEHFETNPGRVSEALREREP